MTALQVARFVTALSRREQVALALLWGWVLLVAGGPLLLEPGATGDLSGYVGRVDNLETIDAMNPVAAVVYWLGDANCHTISSRSYTYAGNQMPFCARDLGIFAGLALGFTVALRRRPELSLPLVLLALVPIGLDGTIQLLTDYESTNPRRLITGLLAGGVTGWALMIILEPRRNQGHG